MEILHNIPIYWINLNRCIDRREFMESQFKQYNINNIHRIEAIDGKNLDPLQYNFMHSIIPIKLNILEIACTLSHIKALQQCYNDNNEYGIIMEDDCDFRYLQYHTIYIKKLFDNNDADIIQLVTTLNANELLEIKKKYFANTQCIQQKLIKGYKWNASAYIIKRDAIKKILKLTANLTEADHYVYHHVNTYYTMVPYFRIGTTYDTLIHDTTLNIHNNLVKYNTIFWDKYFNNIKTIQ